MSKPMKVMRVKKMDPRTYRRQQRIKYFLFGTAMLIMLAMIVIGISMIAMDIMKSAEDGTSSGVVSDMREYKEADALSYVVIDVSQEDKKEADTFTLIKFTPRLKGVVMATFPKETGITVNGAKGTLGSVYAQEGTEAMLDGFTGLIGYRPQGYVIVNASAMLSLIDLFDGVTVSVLEDVKSATGGNISFAKGTHKLSGRQAAEILNYEKWSGGAPEKWIMTSKIHAALINENCIGGTYEKMTRYYKRVYNTVDGATNISSLVFDNACNGIVYIANLNTNKSICKIIEVKGEYQEDGAVFTLDNSSYEELNLYFRSDDN